MEIEHAFVQEGEGELELEQVYLEQNLAYMGIENTFIKYGTILMPLGIIMKYTNHLPFTESIEQ